MDFKVEGRFAREVFSFKEYPLLFTSNCSPCFGIKAG